MTWSVPTLCSVSRSVTSRCQICDRTDIPGVANENLRIWLKILCYLTAIQQIVVRLQIWMREVEQLVKLHNLYIHQVMVCCDLRFLFEAKVAGTIKWNCGACTTRSKNRRLMSSKGNNPAKRKLVGLLAGSGTEPNRTAGQIPDSWRVTQTRCYQLCSTGSLPQAMHVHLYA